MRHVRPVTLSVLLIFGALPGAALACQWACATAGAQQGQAAHHDHSAAADEAPRAPEGPLLQSVDLPCAHPGGTTPAISSYFAHKTAPGVIELPHLRIAHRVPGVVTSVRATHSPPDARSAPLSLRV